MNPLWGVVWFFAIISIVCGVAAWAQWKHIRSRAAKETK